MGNPAELIRDAIHAWIREDAGTAIQMTMDRKKHDALAARILSAMLAARGRT